MNEELLKIYRLVVERINMITKTDTYTEIDEYRKQGALSELEELKELLDTMI